MTQSDFASISLSTRLSFYRVEKVLTCSNHLVLEVRTNCKQVVHRLRVKSLTRQGRVEDLTVHTFDIFQKDPSLSHIRGEPTLFDESFPPLFKPPTKSVSTRNMTESWPTVTVSCRFLIASLPVPVRLSAALAPLPPSGAAAAPVPVALSEPVENEVEEPRASEGLQLTTQVVRTSASVDDFLNKDTLYILEQYGTRLPPLIQSSEYYQPRQYIQPSNVHTAVFHNRIVSTMVVATIQAGFQISVMIQYTVPKTFYLNRDALAPQSSKAMPTADQGILSVSQTPISQTETEPSATSSAHSALENAVHNLDFILLLILKAHALSLPVQFYLLRLIL